MHRRRHTAARPAAVGRRQPAVIEPHDPIRHAEISVVMADHENRFAASAKFGQQLRVKHFLEQGVLIGGPLVEEIHGPVFEVCGQQGEPLALPLR
jgi:hypothetical protein